MMILRKSKKQENVITMKEITNNEYSEKIVCQECGYIGFRSAEIQELKVSPDDKEPFYATIVKHFVCPVCGSSEFSSSLVKGKISNKDNVITLAKG